MLLRVGGENLSDAGIEPAAENRGKTGLLELLAVRPLPGIFEVRLVRRLVIGRIEIAHAGFQTRVHDREILIRQRDVHNKIGLEIPDERDQPRHIHRIDLGGGDEGLPFGKLRG